MLIAAGSMHLRPEALPTLREILGQHRQKTMAEEGCVFFSLGVADAASGEVTVLEIWRDEAALSAHHRQPHLAYFMERLGRDITAIDIALYDAIGSRPLPPLDTLGNLGSDSQEAAS